MKEMPDTIDAAVETARKLKAVELAQKRFYRERRGSDQVTATLAQVTVNECPGQVGQTVTADVQRFNGANVKLNKLPPPPPPQQASSSKKRNFITVLAL